MARFKADQVENYKPTGTGAYFSLENDKDYEQVRLMYNDMNDVELFSVHEVEVDGKTYWISCNREYDQPVDSCPLCKSGNRLQVKMWVPLYIEKTKEVKIWERGRTFVSKLESASRRFSPLVSNIFEIERNGKKGDQNTTYELIHIEHDDMKLSDLPPMPEIVGTFVKELTQEEMEKFVASGKLPDSQQSQRNPETDRPPVRQQEVVRRSTTTRTRSAETTEAPRTDVF